MKSTDFGVFQIDHDQLDACMKEKRYYRDLANDEKKIFSLAKMISCISVHNS